MAREQATPSKDFSRGLYAPANKFDQPPNTVPRISNLVLTRRGSLRTVDGTLIQSSLNGAGATTGQNPFRFIGYYSPTTVAARIIAISTDGTNARFYNVTGASYSAAFATFACTVTSPSFVQLGDRLLAALGADQVPQFINSDLTTTVLNNIWSASGSIPQWQANQAVQQGTVIIPNPQNGHVYIALTSGVTNATTQPTFPTTANANVLDVGNGGSVLWQEAGPDGVPVPNAAFVFYHLGYLFCWGTAATYLANNIDGPDALRQSDLQLFNSFNPINAGFVGRGDGQKPQGGAVMTLGEAGISATAQLVLFKDISTYSVFGAFPTATIQKSPTGVGCVAPASVLFMDDILGPGAGGIVRLSSRGVAVFDGQGDTVDQWTDPIRPYLFGLSGSGINGIDWQNANKSVATRTENPSCYVLTCPLAGNAGGLSRSFVYDILAQGWTVIDWPFLIGASAYLPLLAQANRILVGGFSDGTIRRWFAGDSTWDGTAVSWSFRTPEVGNPVTPTFVKELDINGHVVAGTPRFTKAALNYTDRDGTPQAEQEPTPATGVAISIDIFRTLISMNLDLAGIDAMEIDGMELASSPKPFAKIDRAGVQASQPANQVVTVIFSQQGNQAVPALATSVAVTLNPAAPSVNYQPEVIPSWNTTFWYSGQTVNGFTINFNTPAPGDGSGNIWWGAEITQ